MALVGPRDRPYRSLSFSPGEKAISALLGSIHHHSIVETMLMGILLLHMSNVLFWWKMGWLHPRGYQLKVPSFKILIGFG